MRLVFDERKASQAAAHLLKKTPERSQDKLKLMKLLYLADRLSLVETGYTITGDAPFSMRYGPILSNTLSIMNDGTHSGDSLWEQSFQLGPGYQVQLDHDPGRDDLSDYELEVLDRTFDRYGEMDRWDLVAFTHTLPEYDTSVGDSSSPISLDEVLASSGMDAKTIRDLKALAREIELLHRLPRGS